MMDADTGRRPTLTGYTVPSENSETGKVTGPYRALWMPLLVTARSP